jgi:hypothetical protein
MNWNEKVDKFYKDLSFGNKSERWISKWLNKKFNWSIKSFGNNSDWDIEMVKNNKSLYVECKTDTWEHWNYKTGNIFLEIKCNGKDSGVRKTKSDLYIFFYPYEGEIWIGKTKEIKEWISNNKNLYIKYGCGDGGKVTSIIINRYEDEHPFKLFRIN